MHSCTEINCFWMEMIECYHKDWELLKRDFTSKLSEWVEGASLTLCHNSLISTQFTGENLFSKDLYPMYVDHEKLIFIQMYECQVE